jgi:hypothetical protein
MGDDLLHHVSVEVRWGFLGALWGGGTSLNLEALGEQLAPSVGELLVI